MLAVHCSYLLLSSAADVFSDGRRTAPAYFLREILDIHGSALSPPCMVLYGNGFGSVSPVVFV
jgi:hypothetical protein